LDINERLRLLKSATNGDDDAKWLVVVVVVGGAKASFDLMRNTVTVAKRNKTLIVMATDLGW
jgi:hypothetical protein